MDDSKDRDQEVRRVPLGVAGLFGLLLVTAGANPLRGQSAEEIVLLQASAHPIRYYLFSPKEDEPRCSRHRPILVCLAGADGDPRAMAARYRRASEASPFAIVSPCTFSNVNLLRGELLERYRRLYTDEVMEQAGGLGLLPDIGRRLDWDEAGLLAILKDLADRRGTDGRIYLTGFSGGGLLTYRMIIRHPDRLAGAATVCANFNFWNHGYHNSPPPRCPGNKEVPLFIISGGRDPLRHYRFGGSVLPSLAWILPVLACATTIGCFVLARTRRRKQAVLLAVAGALGTGLFLVGRWSGNETQADCAAQLLRDLGYCRVERTILPDLPHDPAAKHVVGIFRALQEASGVASHAKVLTRSARTGNHALLLSPASEKTSSSRSHAPRGNARRDALRPVPRRRLPRRRASHACVPTRSVATRGSFSRRDSVGLRAGRIQ